MNTTSNTLLRVRRRSDYLPTVSALMPSATEKEAELRCSVLMARDSASIGIRRCCEDAYAVLQLVERLATRYAFTPMPMPALEHTRYVLLRLLGSANSLETVSSLIEGGADERG